jgi:CheY-like chemotaxis protein
MNKTRIMIIDDDELFLSLTELFLEKVPYLDEILTMNGGTEAQEFLDSRTARNDPFPDVILVDINMPKMNGFEFAQLYNEHYADKYPDTKLVMLSSSISSKDKARGMQIPGVQDFIEKPLTEGTLRRLLDGNMISR